MDFSYSLSHLNENQKRAVMAVTNNVLIVAGAGTGKTRVIIDRILYILSQKLVEPENILAITFTKKAALEMQERLDVALPYGYTSPSIDTFHALAEKILRSHAHLIGLNPAFRLLSKSEEYMFFKSHLFEFSLSQFRPHGAPNKFIYFLLDYFSRLSDENISVEKFSDWAIEKNDAESMELAAVYKEYDALKKKEGVMGFSDLMMNAYILLSQSKQALRFYRDTYRYIMVDEFQDTNYLQSLLLYLLAGSEDEEGKSNLFVVGDDSQSIYRFRGAAVSNILHYRDRYPSCDVIVLNTNYRSFQEILDTSYRLIKYNDPHTLEYKEGISKKLIAQRKEEENRDRVSFNFYENVADESNGIANQILLMHEQGYAFRQMAVLVRSNDHATMIVKEFQVLGIPYSLGRKVDLFAESIVRDFIAYIYILANGYDDVSMYRFMNSPLSGLDTYGVWELCCYARDKKITLITAMKSIIELYDSYVELNEDSKYDDMKDGGGEENDQKKYFEQNGMSKYFAFDSKYKVNVQFVSSLKGFSEEFYENIQLSSQGRSIDEILYKVFSQNSVAPGVKEEEEKIVKFFSYLSSLREKFDPLDVQQFISYFEGIGAGVDMVEDDLSENDTINVLTVHAAKGLEFEVVFIPSLVDGRFPSRDRSEVFSIPMELSSDEIPEKLAKLEEERRLFYVAVTRAKDYAYLSGAQFYSGKVNKKRISPFVFEALESVNTNVVKHEIESATKATELPANNASFQPSFFPNMDTIMEKVSYYQIDYYDTCPLKYYNKFIAHTPSQITSELSFGTSMHNCLAAFFRLVMQGRKPTEEDLIKLFREKWVSDGYDSEAHRIARRDAGEAVLRAHFKDLYTGFEHPVFIEQPFDVILEGCHITGRIDRIDRDENGYRLIDYKTGDVRKQSDVDKNLQLAIYTLAAYQLLGEMPMSSELLFVEKGKSIIQKEGTKTMNELIRKIQTLQEGVKKKDFHPNPGFHCNYCEFKGICKFAYK